MIVHTKEQLHIFMHAKKIKYKYLSMKKVSIYIFFSRNASGINRRHLNSVLNSRV
jgi:hypothetical protein